MNNFQFVILDARGNEAYLYWRSDKDTTEEAEQEIFEHFNQLPVFIERVE